MGSLSVLEVIRELYIALTALLFNLVFWMILEKQGFRRSAATRAFCNTAMAVFFANLLSCVTTVFQHSDLYLPPAAVSALQMVVYFFNVLVPYYFSIYIVRFFSRQDGREHRIPRINTVMVICQAVILSGWFAYAAPKMIRTGTYIETSWPVFIIAGFVMELYHLFYCILFFAKHRSILRRKERNAVMLGFFLVVVTVVLQAFIGPLPLVNYLGATIGLLVFYFAAEQSKISEVIPVGTGQDNEEVPLMEKDLKLREGEYIHTEREPSRGRRRLRKRSIIRTVFALMSVLVFGSYILLGALLYRRSKDIFLEELRGNALAQAGTIAASVDAAAFSRLYYGCEGNADYNSVMDTLVLFRDHSGMQYVYTCWYDESGEVPVMCVDSDPVAPGAMGDDLGYAEATHLALHGTAAVYDMPVTDDWGAHLSAFAPITYEGIVYGAVGVDVDYEWVRSKLMGVVTLIAGICLVCFALTLFALYVLSRHLREKFRLLNSKIDVLSYDADHLTRIEGLRDGDEFELIAEHINEVFEENAARQRQEADKLRSAMEVVENSAKEKLEQAKEKESRAEDVMRQTRLLKESASTAQMPEAKTPDRAEAVKQAKYRLPEPEEGMSKEEAIRRVQEATPLMIEAYTALKDALQSYFGNTEESPAPDAELPEMEQEELDELFEAIREFAGMYDQDGILNLLTQAEGYAIPETEKERIEQIKKCAQNSDWSGVNDVMNR